MFSAKPKPSANAYIPSATMVKTEPIEDDYTGTVDTSHEEEEEEDKTLPPRTPGKREKIKIGEPATGSPKTPKINADSYGSVATPIGRRSARVAARSSAKKM